MLAMDERSALLFPGQGSQFAGMLQGIERIEGATDLFETAREILGYDLLELCSRADKRTLGDTAVTQPAVFVTSLSLYFLWVRSSSDEGSPPSRQGDSTVFGTDAAGHSLGEYTALVASGMLAFEDALKLVAVRGEAMKRACEETPGAMVALLGSDLAKAEEACSRMRDKGHPIWVANINAPGQVVVSGAIEAVSRAVAAPSDFGARRAVMLDVAGACHTPLMQSACGSLEKALQEVEFREPRMKVWSNVTAKPYSSAAEAKELLVRQLVEPVLWHRTLENLAAEGTTTFYCFGPSDTMAGIARRCLQTDDVAGNGVRISRIENFAAAAGTSATDLAEKGSG